MDPGLLLTIGSGGVLAAFGLFLLAADPRRDWNRAFALFAVFWGLQIVMANAIRLTENLALAQVFGTLTLALVIPLYFFLIVFTSIFPRPRPPFATSWTALLLLLTPAAIALGTLLVAPRLLIAEVVAQPTGGATMDWGPLFPPLVVAPLYAGFFYALFVMMQRLRQAERPIERRQVVIVLTALTLVVAYTVPRELIRFGAPFVGGTAASEAAALTAALIGLIMLAGLVLLGVLAARLVRAWHASASRTAAREMRAAILALAAALAVGATVGLLHATLGVDLEALGLVRVIAVGLIAYGVARYQLFDLDLRVKNAVPLVTTAILAAMGTVIAWSILRAAGVGTIPRAALALGVVVALATILAFAVRRLLDRLLPHLAPRHAHLDMRRLEVYRAALEAREHTAKPDPDGLDGLAKRLRLSADERRLAERLARQAPQQLAPGLLAFDRYLIEARIGEGAYGRVFLARDTQLGRRVVIKELEARWRGEPSVFLRFLREAKIMGRLRHPNIVRLLEVERRGDDHFLLLEHIEGGTLADRLAGGRLAVPDAAAIAWDLAAALEAAHGRGIVHRDLKPANVLLDLDGRARLADFGVASLFTAARDETLTTLPAPGEATIVGNLQYMAPEQARGAAAEPRADLYALGAILYHMVVGRPHRDFRGLDAEAATARVAQAGAPKPTAIPDALRPLLLSLLHPEPDERPPDAASVARRLAPLARRADQRAEGAPTPAPRDPLQGPAKA